MAIPSAEDLALLLVIAGVVVSILEALAPGAHLVVLGVALLVAGLVGLLAASVGFPLGPLALAALVLGSGGAALWAYRTFDFYGGRGSGVTSDSSRLAGETGHVVDRVSRSGGRVRLDDGGFDPFYSARTIDGEIPEGAEVIVIDPGGGSVLTVEAIDGVGMDGIDRELARERERSEGGASGGSESGDAESGDTESGGAESGGAEREAERERE